MMAKVYDELIDFIAAGSKPEEVAQFQPSPEAKARAWDLVRQEKAELLDEAGKAELSHYMQLEYILRMAKARARQGLTGRTQEDSLPHE